MTDQNLVAKYKGQLNRNRSDLLTAQGARKNALTQISAPNLSDAERAKFRRLYKKYDDAVKRLEAEREQLNKNLNKAQADVPTYDKKAGKKEASALKDQYSLLKDSYNTVTDKNSSEAKNIKSQMDELISKFQKAYSESIGAPVSKSVAAANISGTKLSTGSPVDEAVTLQATATAKETAGKEAATKGRSTGTGSKTTSPAKVADVSKVGSAPADIASGAYLNKPTSKFEDLIGRTEFWYNLPDYIFKVNPALQDILVKAVDEGWTDEKFLNSAMQTPWWQQNSAAIRTRIIDKAKYDELRSQGLDVSKTDYGLDSQTIRRRIDSLAKQKGANLTPEQLDQVVSQAYNGFLENDSVALTQLIAPYIGKVPAIIGAGLPGAGGATSAYSGEALKNYQALQDLARQNGFKLADILPRISTATGQSLEDAVLQKLTTGDLDINSIAQNARTLAAAGQPQYVRDLLNQGYDLSAVYAPYRQTMASTLELNPDKIDLNDPTLRMAITDKGDMNLYDFSKLLRQDNRWQYTQQAQSEVSNAVQQVLKDFGFMG